MEQIVNLGLDRVLYSQMVLERVHQDYYLNLDLVGQEAANYQILVGHLGLL
jgi:hypothetical protein